MAELKEEKRTKEDEFDTESIAMNLLKEFKLQNKRMSSALIACVISFAISTFAIVVGFLIYLNQYDFSGTIEQTGLYTFVDSDGNVISSDITPEQMEEILEVINGDSKNNEETD